MNEVQLEQAMQLIFVAGNAKSMAMNAILEAENGNLVRSQEVIKEAKQTLHDAHSIQTGWLTSEMNGEIIEKSILLIHSQDHFTTANIMIDLAERFQMLYSKLEKVMNQNE
ncbi:PTS lactose/cellobiose transporter subunit IIA [Listeria welshimeri]|nr:PTS lactose/cellobiose transporter subunit IIA [Listeria welshimeri]MBC1342676.1 PTS lactose/cellobiose transporter subunit IIA [Listeria welshimeri]MBC1346153.1 PTS lactose/cellobiose transporter subunit IIA [Listeria welshimeri]MBC1348280.1 PTS lactose/cellobiose transporter subunit IIA [Listeria welshimeri]MBC1361106.1 PTS lactose/cellobiose transporter subunit IIA [Listeria welshimeri]